MRSVSIPYPYMTTSAARTAPTTRMAHMIQSPRRRCRRRSSGVGNLSWYAKGLTSFPYISILCYRHHTFFEEGYMSMHNLTLGYLGNHQKYPDVTDGLARWRLGFGGNPVRANLPTNEEIESKELPYGDRLMVSVHERGKNHVVIHMSTGCTNEIRRKWLRALEQFIPEQS